MADNALSCTIQQVNRAACRIYFNLISVYMTRVRLLNLPAAQIDFPIMQGTVYLFPAHHPFRKLASFMRALVFDGENISVR